MQCMDQRLGFFKHGAVCFLALFLLRIVLEGRCRCMSTNFWFRHQHLHMFVSPIRSPERPRFEFVFCAVWPTIKIDFFERLSRKNRQFCNCGGWFKRAATVTVSQPTRSRVLYSKNSVVAVARILALNANSSVAGSLRRSLFATNGA